MATQTRVETSIHRALAEPSRAAIVAALEQAGKALDASELGRRIGRHPNTVRWHLAALVEAGLVRSHAERRSTPGRPRLVYEPASGRTPRADPGHALAAALLGIAAGAPRAGSAAVEEGRSWGRRVVREGRVSRQSDPVTALVELLDAHGFEPATSGHEVDMYACPYGDLASASPEIVCGIHRGLVEGALEELGAALEVEALDVFPRPDVCVVHLREDGHAVTTG